MRLLVTAAIALAACTHDPEPGEIVCTSVGFGDRKCAPTAGPDDPRGDKTGDDSTLAIQARAEQHPTYGDRPLYCVTADEIGAECFAAAVSCQAERSNKGLAGNCVERTEAYCYGVERRADPTKWSVCMSDVDNCEQRRKRDVALEADTIRVTMRHCGVYRVRQASAPQSAPADAGAAPADASKP